MQLNIKHAGKDGHGLGPTLIATGTLRGPNPQHLVGIHGVCTQATDPVHQKCKPTMTAIPPTIEGQTFFFARVHHKHGTRPAILYRWGIVFKFDPPQAGRAAYTMTVTGYDADCGTTQDSVDVCWTPIRQEDALIDFPSSPGSIAAEAEDFVPYGFLSSDDLVVSVTLTQTNPTPQITIPPLYIFNDPTELNLWSAEFDALTAGSTYTLDITTQNGVQRSVTGLTA